MKCGYISICGLPNAGKSTLINRLLGEKLAIVSHKPQTTRKKMIYLFTDENSQIVLLDTPGYFPKAKNKLDEFLLEQIEEAQKGCDLILYMTSDKVTSPREEEFVNSILHSNSICIINKSDTFTKEELETRKKGLEKIGFKGEICHISALNGDGIEELLAKIKELLPEEENYLYDPELISLEKTRDIVEELIRGELFLILEQELPYVCGVSLEEMKTRDNGLEYISATIYCERDSQKKIIIGKKGNNLRKIGIAARNAIEDFLGKKVYLDIWIKVYPKWRKNQNMLNNLGYKRT